MSGTPKDLREAISIAIQESWGLDLSLGEMTDKIQAAVKDRLSQDFGAMALDDQTGTVMKLWQKIFPLGGMSDAAKRFKERISK